jgi:hypothetical protein
MKDAFDRMDKRNKEQQRKMMDEVIEWPRPGHAALEWEAHGLSCAIKNGYVALCGYVKVPDGHPCERLWYDDVKVDVHGGLTFRCKVKDGSWFGFDCGHFGDWWGYAEKGHAFENPGKIWTIDDVKAETERLAEQLAKLATSIGEPKGQPERSS